VLLEGGLVSRGVIEDMQQPCRFNRSCSGRGLSREGREQHSGSVLRDTVLSLQLALFNSCIWVHINHHLYLAR
jgi:hypothetical protein